MENGLKTLQLCFREGKYNQNELYEILQVSTSQIFEWKKGQESKMCGSLRTLEEERQQSCSSDVQRECHPVDALTLAQGIPPCTSEF